MDSKQELILIPKYEKYMQYMIDVIIKIPRTEKFNIGNDEVIEVDVTSEIEALETGQKVRIERIQGNKITVRSVI